MASAADLPVHLVEDIFLRLDDSTDLVRASAACAAFRRVISDGRFLRRSFSGGHHFHPAEPPRHSAHAASLSSSSFLSADPNPSGHRWHVHDARDGRVLLSPGDGDATTCCLPSFSNLVVYDPLYRKHVEIPPIPKDIVAGHGHYCSCSDCECQFSPFLIPAAAAEDEDALSFRVMCTVLSTGLEDRCVLESFIYSSITGKLRGVASSSNVNYGTLRDLSSMDRHYAHGCFYWLDCCEKDMLVLDMNEMKFSVVNLPSGAKQGNMKIVVDGAEQDRIGLLVRHENTLHLYSKANGGANDGWQRRHEPVVTLPYDSFVWFFDGAADQGYALIHGVRRREYETLMYSAPEMNRKAKAYYFTVEVQTLLVEKLCEVEVEFDTEPAFLYASFPPPFAPPRL